MQCKSALQNNQRSNADFILQCACIKENYKMVAYRRVKILGIKKFGEIVILKHWQIQSLPVF